MAMLFCFMIFGLISNSKGSVTILVPKAGNCNEDTILTCHVSSNISFTGWTGFQRSIVLNGIPVRPEDNDKYTETRGTSYFTLSIHNTDITDVGDYKCKNGFHESNLVRLNFECKASSVMLNVTNGKKVHLSVDKLYPAFPDFNVSFEKEKNVIKVSGSKTCTRSIRFSDYFRCVWNSDSSLGDGTYNYSIVVTTITQADPLTGSFKIVSPDSPHISNVVKREDGRETIVGYERQVLKIQCTSYGGYPSPSLTWYRSSVSSSNQMGSTSNGMLQSNGTYTVLLQHTFIPTRSDDKMKIICRSYYPQADQAYIASNTKFVLLFLLLVPRQPIITQTSVVSEGENLEVMCRTSGCRPVANITWLYKGTTVRGQINFTLESATETYDVVSIFTMQVTAGDNAQSIHCIVTHPALVRPSELSASYQLSVEYPPNVSVNTKNTTVKASKINLTCIAKGVPDNNYTYGKWIQRWPENYVPVCEIPGSETLELTALTYEHSGYYTCTASNGIKVFDKNRYYVEGTATQLLVKSFPVITSFDAKIASTLNKNLTITLDYFSNVPGSDVILYKNMNNEMKPMTIYSVSMHAVEIELPVFTHLIKTKGTKASFYIQIKSVEDFGTYSFAVTNELGSSYRSFEVVMTEPPSKPSGFTVNYIQDNKVRLSWKREYNGGLPQTFVIQLGTDKKKWSDVNVKDGFKQDEIPISTILTDLHDSTTYFVRLYAYNNDGKSTLSETLNFTTTQIKVKTNKASTLIVGVVQGLLNVVLVIYAIYITVLLKRRVPKKKGESGQTSDQTYANVDDSIRLKTTDAARRENSQGDDGTNESQYTGLDKDLRGSESAYDAISAI